MAMVAAENEKKMRMSVEEVARIVNGEVIGDKNIVITGICGIKEAKEGDLAFVANNKYLPLIKNTAASAIITSRDVKKAAKTIIRAENPSLAFSKSAGRVTFQLYCVEFCHAYHVLFESTLCQPPLHHHSSTRRY